MVPSCTWCHFIRARKPNTQLAVHRWASWGSLPKLRTNQTCTIHYSHWLQREFGTAQKKENVIHSQKWKHCSRSFIHQRLESKRKKNKCGGGKSNIPVEMLEAQEISKNNWDSDSTGLSHVSLSSGSQEPFETLVPLFSWQEIVQGSWESSGSIYMEEPSQKLRCRAQSASSSSSFSRLFRGTRCILGQEGQQGDDKEISRNGQNSISLAHGWGNVWFHFQNDLNKNVFPPR